MKAMKSGITQFIHRYVTARLLAVLCAWAGPMGSAGRLGRDDDDKNF